MPNSTNPGGTSASASDGPRRSGRVLAKAIRDEEEKKKGGEKRKREEEEEEEGDDEEHCGVDDDDDEYGKRPRKRVNKGKAPARKAPKGKAPAIQPTKPKAGASGPTKRTTDSPNEPSTPEYVQSEADTSANSPTPAGTSNDEASLSKFDAAKRRFPPGTLVYAKKGGKGKPVEGRVASVGERLGTITIYWQPRLKSGKFSESPHAEHINDVQTSEEYNAD